MIAFHESLCLLARYNCWANNRIFQACGKLAEADFKRDLRAYFGSIHRTLNHILVIDRNWFNRITGNDEVVGTPSSILYEDFTSLNDERKKQDDFILATIACLRPDELPEMIPYRFDNMAPDIPFLVVTPNGSKIPLGIILLTLFNHQTHHRGQIHAMLSQLDASPPDIDLIGFYARHGSDLNKR